MRLSLCDSLVAMHDGSITCFFHKNRIVGIKMRHYFYKVGFTFDLCWSSQKLTLSPRSRFLRTNSVSLSSNLSLTYLLAFSDPSLESIFLSSIKKEYSESFSTVLSYYTLTCICWFFGYCLCFYRGMADFEEVVYEFFNVTLVLLFNYYSRTKHFAAWYIILY